MFLRTFPQVKQNSPENEAKERDPLLINRKDFKMAALAT